MKRFLLFTVTHHYAYGECDSLRGDFDTVESAKASAVGTSDEYYRIVDTESCDIVAQGSI